MKIKVVIFVIKKCWDFECPENDNLNKVINNYFEKLKSNRNKRDKTINIRETLIVKVKDLFDPEVCLIMELLNSLGQIQYMPIILFLVENENSNRSTFDSYTLKYKRIEPRLIFIENYSENPEFIEEKIFQKLLRICSIHNELGDRFNLIEGDKVIEEYDLIEQYYPFNINIACIGRFGQGKSTGVNTILKEYKAKESSKGSSQTKELTFYQAYKCPVRVLDIPGFENVETVKKAIEKFKMCEDKINKIKDNLHIVLYFLRFTEDRKFMDLELPILEELVKHKSTKIIYVVTHCNPNMDDVDKEDEIIKIQEGIQGITKNKDIYNETTEGGMLYPSINNVVFVNFHKDIKTGFEPFGTKDLFKKIHDFFIKTEDYLTSKNKLDPELVEKNALKLRAQGEEILLANKIWGGVVGIIPGIDWILQKFVVKKNAAKKLGQLFGIDVKFVEEENKTKKEIKKPEYITPSIDDEQFSLKGEELTKESSTYKVGNSVKVTSEAGAYIGGGTAISTGIARTAATVAETGSGAATSTVVGFGTTTLKVVGTVAFIVGALFGVGLGGYFTHKYCEELLDKFVEYYKKNAEKIGLSYQKAEEYFKV
jgi:GTP-binding protein EngB required for normal cell division